jgi:hypothetical protein
LREADRVRFDAEDSMTRQATVSQNAFAALMRIVGTAVGLAGGSLATLVIFRGFTSLS